MKRNQKVPEVIEVPMETGRRVPLMAPSHQRITKILLLLPNALLEAVEDVRYSNRIGNRNETLRMLLEFGLDRATSAGVGEWMRSGAKFPLDPSRSAG
jgi:hypothetical protein